MKSRGGGVRRLAELVANPRPKKGERGSTWGLKQGLNVVETLLRGKETRGNQDVLSLVKLVVFKASRGRKRRTRKSGTGILPSQDAEGGNGKRSSG